MELHLGFSPCPNDTFIFDAMLHGKIDTEGITFIPVIEDVESLNQKALQQELAITKLSYHAFAHLVDKYILLDAGSALGFGVGVIAIVAMSMASTNESYPITTPLQAGLLRGIKSIDMPVPTVAVKIEDATYRVPGRAMQMTMTITNNGDSAIRLGEFNTAGVRFLDAAVAQDETGYPDDLLAEEGLTVSDNSPIAPGQSRTIQVTASDAAWEVYRLADLIYDPDSRFAGLLFFYDQSGNRQMVTIDAPLIPSFI